MFSIISHDLKNPFIVIQNYIALLLKEDLPKTTQDNYLKRINNASYQLVNLINNLLEWARSQTEKIKFNPSFIDLNDVIDKVAEITKINAQNKNIEIKKTFDKKNKIAIYADKNLLERILYNLIGNAIKFTPKNGLISIGWDIEKNIITFCIKDSGIGMSSDVADTIFENSMENINYGTEGEPGTGLGLNICKEFIKKHNGKIWATSKLGEGSQFYFSIPLKIKDI